MTRALASWTLRICQCRLVIGAPIALLIDIGDANVAAHPVTGINIF